MIERGSNLNRAEAAELTGRIAGLTAAGLPLADGLRALGAEFPRARFRRILEQVAEAIERGEPMDAALAGIQHRLPADVRGLALAAIRSGQVAEVLGASARLQRLSAYLRRRISLGLIYPLALVNFFLATLVVFAFVARDFEHIFADFGVNLPWITVVVLAVSRFLVDSAFPLTVGFILIWAMVFALNLSLRAGGRRLVTSLPLLGPLSRSITLAEFSQLLATLVECQIPLPEAVTLAGEATRDAELIQASATISRQLEEGRPLADAIDDQSAFPDGYGALLRWAGRGGSLAGALQVMGEIFEARARPQASFVSTFITIVVVTLVLFGIGFLQAALFLPLIKLVSALSG